MLLLCRRFSPAVVVALLLPAEIVLFLSERFRFWPGQSKGTTVLLGCVAVPAVLIVLLLWFAAAMALRRRFQFSLFSVLALVTVSALPMSWLAWEVRLADRQRDDVARLAARGVQIVYDYQLRPVPKPSVGSLGAVFLNSDKSSSNVPPSPSMLRRFLGPDFFADVIAVSFSDAAADPADMPDPFGMSGEPSEESLSKLRLKWNYVDADLEPIRRFRHLRAFQCSMTRITDSALENLDDLPELEEVWLDHNFALTDAGLRHLAGRQRLMHLFVYEPQVGDAGIECLGSVPNLELLELHGMEITGRGMSRIALSFPKLRYLDIGETKITEEGVARLVGLTRLETLSLRSTGVTGKDMAALAAVASLRALNLGWTNVGDEGLAEIARLNNLDFLDLTNTKITDAGLAHLARMHNLKRLELWNLQDRVSQQAISALQRALPNCNIEFVVDGP